MERVPDDVREHALLRYRNLFCKDPFHPALQAHLLTDYERDGKRVYSVSVGWGWRALAMYWIEGGKKQFAWYWIGSHEEYNGLTKRRKR